MLMITLTKFNGSAVVINAELIETVESTPDTIVTLINGKKILVQEPVEDIIELVIVYRQRTLKDLIYYREEAGS